MKPWKERRKNIIGLSEEWDAHDTYSYMQILKKILKK